MLCMHFSEAGCKPARLTEMIMRPMKANDTLRMFRVRQQSTWKKLQVSPIPLLQNGAAVLSIKFH